MSTYYLLYLVQVQTVNHNVLEVQSNDLDSQNHDIFFSGMHLWISTTSSERARTCRREDLVVENAEDGSEMGVLRITLRILDVLHQLNF